MDKEASAKLFRDGAIQGALRKCASIFDSGIFSPENFGHALFEPAVITLLINLNDLLQKAKDDDARVSFSDDVTVADKLSDVTDLVSKCRNAACHIGSPLHFIETNKFTFNVIGGKSPNAMRIGDVYYGCDYEDDIAIYYGAFRLYLRRHALRAFNEIRAIYPDRAF